ncbi:hypothetical protein HDU76_000294 [Blyttiomyces sp. JEL0837]|nr:hypothetical protein HDU76_000294 [Blyttiomyces sp. JEL0837]
MSPMNLSQLVSRLNEELFRTVGGGGTGAAGSASSTSTTSNSSSSPSAMSTSNNNNASVTHSSSSAAAATTTTTTTQTDSTRGTKSKPKSINTNLASFASKTWGRRRKPQILSPIQPSTIANSAGTSGSGPTCENCASPTDTVPSLTSYSNTSTCTSVSTSTSASVQSYTAPIPMSPTASAGSLAKESMHSFDSGYAHSPRSTSSHSQSHHDNMTGVNPSLSMTLSSASTSSALPLPHHHIISPYNQHPHDLLHQHHHTHPHPHPLLPHPHASSQTQLFTPPQTPPPPHHGHNLIHHPIYSSHPHHAHGVVHGGVNGGSQHVNINPHAHPLPITVINPLNTAWVKETLSLESRESRDDFVEPMLVPGDSNEKRARAAVRFAMRRSARLDAFIVERVLGFGSNGVVLGGFMKVMPSVRVALKIIYKKGSRKSGSGGGAGTNSNAGGTSGTGTLVNSSVNGVASSPPKSPSFHIGGWSSSGGKQSGGNPIASSTTTSHGHHHVAVSQNQPATSRLVTKPPAEISILQTLSHRFPHPNIVRCLDSWQDERNHYMITEWHGSDWLADDEDEDEEDDDDDRYGDEDFEDDDGGEVFGDSSMAMSISMEDVNGGESAMGGSSSSLVVGKKVPHNSSVSLSSMSTTASKSSLSLGSMKSGGGGGARNGFGKAKVSGNSAGVGGKYNNGGSINTKTGSASGGSSGLSLSRMSESQQQQQQSLPPLRPYRLQFYNPRVGTMHSLYFSAGSSDLWAWSIAAADRLAELQEEEEEAEAEEVERREREREKGLRDDDMQGKESRGGGGGGGGGGGAQCQHCGETISGAHHSDHVGLARGGTTSTTLAKRKGLPRLPEHIRRSIFSQMAAAVAHLHAHGVAHGDLKEENILLERRRVSSGGRLQRRRGSSSVGGLGKSPSRGDRFQPRRGFADIDEDDFDDEDGSEGDDEDETDDDDFTVVPPVVKLCDFGHALLAPPQQHQLQHPTSSSGNAGGEEDADVISQATMTPGMSSFPPMSRSRSASASTFTKTFTPPTELQGPLIVSYGTPEMCASEIVRYRWEEDCVRPLRKLLQMQPGVAVNPQLSLVLERERAPYHGSTHQSGSRNRDGVDGFKADVFALGLLLFALCYGPGKLPSTTAKTSRAIRKIGALSAGILVRMQYLQQQQQQQQQSSSSSSSPSPSPPHSAGGNSSTSAPTKPHHSLEELMATASVVQRLVLSGEGFYPFPELDAEEGEDGGGIEAGCEELIRGMTMLDPNERMTMEEVMEHPIISLDQPDRPPTVTTSQVKDVPMSTRHNNSTVLGAAPQNRNSSGTSAQEVHVPHQKSPLVNQLPKNTRWTRRKLQEVRSLRLESQDSLSSFTTATLSIKFEIDERRAELTKMTQVSQDAYIQVQLDRLLREGSSRRVSGKKMMKFLAQAGVVVRPKLNGEAGFGVPMSQGERCASCPLCSQPVARSSQCKFDNGTEVPLRIRRTTTSDRTEVPSSVRRTTNSDETVGGPKSNNSFTTLKHATNYEKKIQHFSRRSLTRAFAKSLDVFGQESVICIRDFEVANSRRDLASALASLTNFKSNDQVPPPTRPVRKRIKVHNGKVASYLASVKPRATTTGDCEQVPNNSKGADLFTNLTSLATDGILASTFSNSNHRASKTVNFEINETEDIYVPLFKVSRESVDRLQQQKSAKNGVVFGDWQHIQNENSFGQIANSSSFAEIVLEPSTSSILETADEKAGKNIDIDQVESESGEGRRDSGVADVRQEVNGRDPAVSGDGSHDMRIEKDIQTVVDETSMSNTGNSESNKEFAPKESSKTSSVTVAVLGANDDKVDEIPGAPIPFSHADAGVNDFWGSKDLMGQGNDDKLDLDIIPSRDENIMVELMHPEIPPNFAIIRPEFTYESWKYRWGSIFRDVVFDFGEGFKIAQLENGCGVLGFEPLTEREGPETPIPFSHFNNNGEHVDFLQALEVDNISDGDIQSSLVRWETILNGGVEGRLDNQTLQSSSRSNESSEASNPPGPLTTPGDGSLETNLPVENNYDLDINIATGAHMDSERSEGPIPLLERTESPIPFSEFNDRNDGVDFLQAPQVDHFFDGNVQASLLGSETILNGAVERRVDLQSSVGLNETSEASNPAGLLINRGDGSSETKLPVANNRDLDINIATDANRENERHESPIPLLERHETPFSFGDRLEGPIPFAVRPESPIPFGERPEGPIALNERHESPIPFGEGPPSPIPFGERPQSPIPFGERPEPPILFGERPETPIPFSQFNNNNNNEQVDFLQGLEVDIHPEADMQGDHNAMVNYQENVELQALSTNADLMPTTTSPISSKVKQESSRDSWMCRWGSPLRDSSLSVMEESPVPPIVDNNQIITNTTLEDVELEWVPNVNGDGGELFRRVKGAAEVSYGNDRYSNQVNSNNAQVGQAGSWSAIASFSNLLYRSSTFAPGLDKQNSSTSSTTTNSNKNIITSTQATTSDSLPASQPSNTHPEQQTPFSSLFNNPMTFYQQVTSMFTSNVDTLPTVDTTRLPGSPIISDATDMGRDDGERVYDGYGNGDSCEYDNAEWI